MPVSQLATSEIKKIVLEGNQILRMVQVSRSGLDGEQIAKVSTWVTRLGSMIKKLYGDDSQQRENYNSALSISNFYSMNSEWHDHYAQMIGVAVAVEHDIDNGLLSSFSSLVQADIFTDFLEMGEYLLSEGYKDASAVIIGAVLEDGLRKLAAEHGIEVINSSGKPLTIDPLNTKLARKSVYSKLIQKQITTWAHLRNKAAHGEYDEFSKEQVNMMLIFVQGFLSENFR